MKRHALDRIELLEITGPISPASQPEQPDHQ